MNASASALILTTITLLVGVIALTFLMAWPAMLLWNGCLVGAVNGVNPVGWLQMWGIVILASALFKTTTSTKG